MHAHTHIHRAMRPHFHFRTLLYFRSDKFQRTRNCILFAQKNLSKFHLVSLWTKEIVRWVWLKQLSKRRSKNCLKLLCSTICCSETVSTHTQHQTKLFEILWLVNSKNVYLYLWSLTISSILRYTNVQVACNHFEYICIIYHIPIHFTNDFLNELLALHGFSNWEWANRILLAFSPWNVNVLSIYFKLIFFPFALILLLYWVATLFFIS